MALDVLAGTRPVRTVFGYRILTLGALLIGLGFRLLWVDGPFARTHHWNEGHYACSTINLSRYGLLDQHNDLGDDRTFSPFVPIVLWPTAWVSGWRPWGFRLPLALLGILSLWMFARLARRRWGCPPGATLAGLCTAASAPGLVYYSRNVQLDGPATAFLLTAMWFVSEKTRRARFTGWCFWACCVLAKTSFAVFGPAVLLASVASCPGDWRRARRWGQHCGIFVLGLAPAAVWTVAAFHAAPSAVGGFVLRSQERNWEAIWTAFQKTPGFFVRDFGLVGLGFACLGLAALGFLGQPHWRRLAPPAALAVCWIAFPLTYPSAYSANRYYAYPSLFALSALAGWGAWFVAGQFGRRLRLAILLGTSLLMVGVNARLYPSNYGQIRLAGPALAAARSGNDPFAAARFVSTHRVSEKATLVDYPSTMFYAGGDPNRIRCAYGDVAKAFDPAQCGAVVLNSFSQDKESERALLTRLASLGWREIAPRLWAESNKGF
ncbi:MAG: glycosyltransferase family 39 protein [Candidatus Sumerlaeota bacterium]|nr:glycosyltransferase family 39 protein [Candidatus Sumerlaeota bacterium]